jgi:hypothetical protein
VGCDPGSGGLAAERGIGISRRWPRSMRTPTAWLIVDSSSSPASLVTRVGAVPRTKSPEPNRHAGGDEPAAPGDDDRQIRLDWTPEVTGPARSLSVMGNRSPCPPGDSLNGMNVTVGPKCRVSDGSSHMPTEASGVTLSSPRKRKLDRPTSSTAVGLSEAQLQTNGDQMLGGSSDRRSDLSVHPLGRFT